MRINTALWTRKFPKDGDEYSRVSGPKSAPQGPLYIGSPAQTHLDTAATNGL